MAVPGTQKYCKYEIFESLIDNYLSLDGALVFLISLRKSESVEQKLLHIIKLKNLSCFSPSVDMIS